MPVYLYQILRSDGTEGDIFEWEHSMHEKLTRHPQTGEPVRRVYSSPNLGTKHTEGKTNRLLSNDNLDRKGFTKYERDKQTGKYHKTAGKGPEVLNRPPPGQPK